MNEFTPTPKLEQTVRQALAVPAPSASFSNNLRAKLVARSADMQPKTSLRPAWRLALALTALLAFLLIVFNLPGVATALKNLLGYLPGVGPVSQEIPLRVLAAPVSATRDGYTLSVDKVLASAEETLLFYQISGIPAEAYYQGYEPQGSCRTTLRLPDGTQLDMQGGESGHGQGADQLDGKITFPPIPVSVTEITLRMPCLDPLDHTKTPADWVLPLRLVPAPPDMTIVPIIEVAQTLEPTAAPTTETVIPTPSPAAPAELKLDQVIPAPDGYILVGSFTLLNQPATVTLGDYFYLEDGTVTDASGREFTFLPNPNGYDPFSLDPPFDLQPQSRHWAIQVQPAEFTWPLTFTVRSARAVSTCEPVALEFDTGANPQVGQEWQIDQDVELCSGRRIHVQRAILRSTTRYDLLYTSDSRAPWVSLAFAGYDYNGGGGDCDPNGNCFMGVQYNNGAPSGKLTAILTGKTDIILTGPWQVQWQP